MITLTPADVDKIKQLLEENRQRNIDSLSLQNGGEIDKDNPVVLTCPHASCNIAHVMDNETAILSIINNATKGE